MTRALSIVFAVLALAACNNSSHGNNASPDGGTARDGAVSHDGAVDGGGTMTPGGPEFLSFGTNITTMSETDTVTFVAVLTDPQGLTNLVGGHLTDPTGQIQFGAFIATTQGSYSLSLTWPQIYEATNFQFVGQGPIEFIAEFFDVQGRSDEGHHPHARLPGGNLGNLRRHLLRLPERRRPLRRLRHMQQREQHELHAGRVRGRGRRRLGLEFVHGRMRRRQRHVRDDVHGIRGCRQRRRVHVHESNADGLRLRVQRRSTCDGEQLSDHRACLLLRHRAGGLISRLPKWSELTRRHCAICGRHARCNGTVGVQYLSPIELATVTGGGRVQLLEDAAQAVIQYGPRLGRTAEQIFEDRIRGIRHLVGVTDQSIRKMVEKHGIDHVENAAWTAVRRRIGNAE